MVGAEMRARRSKADAEVAGGGSQCVTVFRMRKRLAGDTVGAQNACSPRTLRDKQTFIYRSDKSEEKTINLNGMHLADS
jgi:hypothetical protein